MQDIVSGTYDKSKNKEEKIKEREIEQGGILENDHNR